MNFIVLILLHLIGYAVYLKIKKVLKKPKKRKKIVLKMDEKYKDDFTTYLDGLKSSEDYKVTAQQLKDLLKRKFIVYDDLTKNPEKFFKMHELLAGPSGVDNISLGIKFTAHTNLFAGSVYFLGSDEQVEELKKSQEDGLMGCFALTEKNSGVVSGLIVETTAKFVDGELILNTPNIATTDAGVVDFENTGACKTWISNGQTCDYAVVFANLTLANGEEKGIHAFVLKLSDYKVNKVVTSQLKEGEGKLMENAMFIELMEGKAALNGLDNSRIIFNSLKISTNTLLSRYCKIDPKTLDYSVIDCKKFSFLLVAQRLLSGRIVIGNTSLFYFKTILDHLKKNVLNVRKIPMGKERTQKLIDLPLIRNYLEDLEYHIAKYKSFTQSVVKELCVYLKEKKPVPNELVERISISKIVATNWCVKKIFELKQMIGSEALFTKNKMGSNLSVFYCCLFAEGDNKILQQKIVRDHLRKLQKGGMIKMLLSYAFVKVVGSFYETKDMKIQKKLIQLGLKLVGSKGREKRMRDWNNSYREILEIADMICYNEVEKAGKKK